MAAAASLLRPARLAPAATSLDAQRNVWSITGVSVCRRGVTCCAGKQRDSQYKLALEKRHVSGSEKGGVAKKGGGAKPQWGRLENGCGWLAGWPGLAGGLAGPGRERCNSARHAAATRSGERAVAAWHCRRARRAALLPAPARRAQWRLLEWRICSGGCRAAHAALTPSSGRGRCARSGGTWPRGPAGPPGSRTASRLRYRQYGKAAGRG